MLYIHQRTYEALYDIRVLYDFQVLSECLWGKKNPCATRAGFEPRTSCLQVQTSYYLNHRACPMTIGRLQSYREGDKRGSVPLLLKINDGQQFKIVSLFSNVGTLVSVCVAIGILNFLIVSPPPFLWNDVQFAAKIAGSIGILPCCALNDFFT